MSRATAGVSLLLAAIVAAYGFRSIDGTEATRPTRPPAGGRPPVLTCYPGAINFNEVPRGQSAQRVVYVENPWDLGGENEGGSIEVHWTVAVAGQDCRLTKSTGKILKLIFTRRSQVYDPVNDKYVNMTGDPDGDGRSSYEEVLKGGDPEEPDR